MATKLTHEIRREIVIDDEPFTVIISSEGLRLSRKRFRSGRRLAWRELWRLGTPEDGADNGEPGSPVSGGTSAV
ncbi:MAG: hypothetical protein ACYCVL_02690 [Gemmatimonadaceae bacterium]